MKKKLILLLVIACMSVCLVACVSGNRHDTIEIYNRNGYTLDNITINTKDGYFYDSHEKFTVDENKIGVTIYFSNIEYDDSWD